MREVSSPIYQCKGWFPHSLLRASQKSLFLFWFGQDSTQYQPQGRTSAKCNSWGLGTLECSKSKPLWPGIGVFPRHPVIPPEELLLRIFKVCFGVQIPSQQVLACLGIVYVYIVLDFSFVQHIQYCKATKRYVSILPHYYYCIVL